MHGMIVHIHVLLLDYYFYSPRRTPDSLLESCESSWDFLIVFLPSRLIYLFIYSHPKKNTHFNTARRHPAPPITLLTNPAGCIHRINLLPQFTHTRQKSVPWQRMASKRAPGNALLKQGEFAGKWIKYDDLLQEVRNDDTVKTLRKQMFRFGLFFPLVMANVLISSQTAAEFDISNALTLTLVNTEFVRPVHKTSTVQDVQLHSAGFMKFDKIASKADFWAVSISAPRWILCC